MTAGQLTQAATKAREWTARRDTLVVEARAQGQSLRAIAQAAGLSHTAVAKILARTKETP